MNAHDTLHIHLRHLYVEETRALEEVSVTVLHFRLVAALLSFKPSDVTTQNSNFKLSSDVTQQNRNA